MFPLFFYVGCMFWCQENLIFKNNLLLNEARGDGTKSLIFKNKDYLYVARERFAEKLNF